MSTFFPPELWASVLISLVCVLLFASVHVFYKKCIAFPLNPHKLMPFWHTYLYDWGVGGGFLLLGDTCIHVLPRSFLPM